MSFTFVKNNTKIKLSPNFFLCDWEKPSVEQIILGQHPSPKTPPLCSV